MTFEERDELAQLFETYGALLTQTQKQALYLKLIEDLSLGEIAEELAVSRQAVNDAINKGKAKLLKIKEGIK